MKKMIRVAFGYAFAAIAAGIFYREFTKLNGFTGRTPLAFIHLHLFALGTIVFLVLVLFGILTDLYKQKFFKPFFVLYNIGLIWMVGMFTVRGVLTVLGASLSRGLDAALSGIAGLGHTVITVALVFLFLCMKKLQPVKR